MRWSSCARLALGAIALLCACDSGRTPHASTKSAVSSDDVVGKWRLVRAGGEAPSALQIKSLRIDIERDGNWKSDIEMEGSFAGMRLQGGGKWSLADGVVSYSSGDNAGKSRVSLEAGRLIL